jgi:hypothetical protein
MEQLRLGRRDFLIGAGVLGGLAIGGKFLGPRAAACLPGSSMAPALTTVLLRKDKARCCARPRPAFTQRSIGYSGSGLSLPMCCDLVAHSERLGKKEPMGGSWCGGQKAPTDPDESYIKRELGDPI